MGPFSREAEKGEVKRSCLFRLAKFLVRLVRFGVDLIFKKGLKGIKY